MGSSRSALAYFFFFFPSIISTIPTVQTYHMRIPRRFGARYRTGGGPKVSKPTILEDKLSLWQFCCLPSLPFSGDIDGTRLYSSIRAEEL